MNPGRNRRHWPATPAILALPAAGGGTPRQLSDIRPGLTMARARERSGRPDGVFQVPNGARGPAESSWYYDPYRARPAFEWQTIFASRPAGRRLEPGQMTVGVLYRRFEIGFQNGVVAGRAEFEFPAGW